MRRHWRLLTAVLCLLAVAGACRRGARPRERGELTPEQKAVVAAFTSGTISRESPIRVALHQAEAAAVYVPVEVDGSVGRVVFEAAHRDPTARVFWHLDDEYQGETRDVHQMALAPRPGAHRLVLVDERGETAGRRFTVVGRDARSSATLEAGL
ncbi:MAG TPA: hypothetical protein VLL75_06190 [Vicinamibacteria bacterium]|nr:hypothetical protein [Vicinamibacteria bacterium]